MTISGSLEGWGDELIPLFSLAIRLVTDTETRIERLKMREKQKFGDRIMPKGDMYTNHTEFIEWARKYDTGNVNMRSRAKHDEWQKLLLCKQIVLNGADALEENVKKVQAEMKDAEIWDLYNENREPLGKDHVRGEQLPVDGYHLVVHVWIRNSRGEYLISQRAVNRPTHPLMWECVGGSVVKGEDSLQGAIREAKEEVGVDLLPENGQVLFTKTRKMIDGKIFNDIMDVWLFEYDGEVDLGNATTDEVAQVVWMNRSQIKELFKQKMFVDTLEYFFTEVDKQPTSHK